MRSNQDTYREDFQRIFPYVIAIASLHVVNPDKQAIIHDVDFPQQFCISSQLLRQQSSFLWSELQHLATVDPIQVLQDSPWVCSGLFLRILSSHSATLQVIRLMDIPMGREEIVHDNEVNFSSVRKLDTMKSIEPGEKRVWIVLHMCVIIF